MISITAINYLLKSKLNTLYIKDIKLLSSNGEYLTCLINDEYIFNIIINPDINQKNSNDTINTINNKISIKTPKIEFSFISDDVVIKGYKKIDGVPLNTNIFNLMPKEKQDKLIKDIVAFLKELHNIDNDNHKNTNDKEKMIQEIAYIKENIYDFLSQNEKKYIDSFLDYLNQIPTLITTNCLSHNSLQYSRFIINEDNELVGVVGFDELDYAPIYVDYIALLEDEEIGSKIIHESGLDLETIKQYKEISDRYYPIKIIYYGIKKNRNDIVEKGRRQIDSKQKKID